VDDVLGFLVEALVVAEVHIGGRGVLRKVHPRALGAAVLAVGGSACVVTAALHKFNASLLVVCHVHFTFIVILNKSFAVT
jgi:hypothetical protein